MDGKTLYLSGPSKPDKDQDLDKYWFVPYFWVEKVHDEQHANMRFVSMKVGKVEFPIPQNIRALKQHETLKVFKAKEVTASLKDCTTVVEEPPAKKADSAGKGKKDSNTKKK